MARDDYHVIVYQILAYLYQRLKKSEPVDPKMLANDGSLLKGQIGTAYWAYIIYMLESSGLITGVAFVDMDGLNVPYAANLDKCMITPMGIEYLCDNSFMEKAKHFAKEAKDIIIPFV